MSKPKIGKQRTVTGAYSPNFNEKGDTYKPDRMYTCDELDDNSDKMNTTGFSAPLPKGK